MSKQAERAAEKVWKGMASCYWDSTDMPIVADLIAEAYAEREKAVAELVREAKEALWLCQSHGLTMDELKAAIEGVDG